MANQEANIKICKEIIRNKDYYEILGVSRTATVDEIKKGYRKKSLKCHPDKVNAPEAEPAFKKLSLAYSCLSDDNKRALYDRYGNEEDFLKAQQSQGQNPFQGFDADDIFSQMFQQMGSQGGGVPPEFAAFFGNQGPRRRRRQNMSPEADLFSDLLGGGGFGGMGPGVRMSFSSMGPGGGVHYSNFGGGRRGHGNGERQESVHQNGYERTGNPVVDLNNCCSYYFSMLCRNLFTILILWNMFGGIITAFIPGFLYTGISRLFMSESNPEYYDYSFSSGPYHQHELTTSTLNLNYFVTDASLESINSLKDEKLDTFKLLEQNIEIKVYDEVEVSCRQAQYERARLLKRARSFFNRAEKREQMVLQAENLPELQYCEKKKKYEAMMNQN